MGIFVPSQGLSDYRLDFLAQIDARGVSWAYRAKDRANYMAARLRVIKPGPRPVLTLVRYAVSGGVKGKAVELPLQVMVHNTPFQVTFEASGDSYRLAVEGERWTSGPKPAPAPGGSGSSAKRASAPASTGCSFRHRRICWGGCARC